MKTKSFVLSMTIVTSLWTGSSAADSTTAHCEIYPIGEDHPAKVLPCTFSQLQGYITITLEDNVKYDLSPDNNRPGVFQNQGGQPVYREKGLGDQGLIFRLKNERVFVYWNSPYSSGTTEENNWSAPFSTKNYDATTRLRCRALSDNSISYCPAGILRMKNNQASIVVKSLDGDIFTINFLTDYINATNREVEATLKGDTWTVIIDGKDLYEVPVAAIEGG